MAGLIGAITAALIATTSPPPFQPVGKWVVSGEEGMCLLSRAYQRGTDRFDFGIRPLGSEDRFEIILATPHDEGPGRAGRATVSIGTAMSFDGRYDSGTLGMPGRLTTITVKADIRLALSDAEIIGIDAGPTKVTLALVNVAAALKILDHCQDLMLAHWGVDAAAYRSEKSHAKIVEAAIYSPDQYPKEALASHAQGRAVALLDVTADGRVAKCGIVKTSGNAALDQRTCALALRRARFIPARRADGQAIASSFVLPVSWLLPSG